eukprot:15114738-Alexandrium_andersonii.AAC.1
MALAAATLPTLLVHMAFRAAASSRCTAPRPRSTSATRPWCWTAGSPSTTRPRSSLAVAARLAAKALRSPAKQSALQRGEQ